MLSLHALNSMQYYLLLQALAARETGGRAEVAVRQEGGRAELAARRLAAAAKKEFFLQAPDAPD